MSRTRKELREIEEELSFHERRLLLTLKDHDGSTVEKLVNSGGFRDQVEVMNAASWLKSKGLVQIEERVERLLQQGSPVYVERGLPERRALKLLSKAGGGDAVEGVQGEDGGGGGEDSHRTPYQEEVGRSEEEGWGKLRIPHREG